MTAKTAPRRARIAHDTAPIARLYGGTLGMLAGEAYKPSKHHQAKRKAAKRRKGKGA